MAASIRSTLPSYPVTAEEQQFIDLAMEASLGCEPEMSIARATNYYAATLLEASIENLAKTTIVADLKETLKNYDVFQYCRTRLSHITLHSLALEKTNYFQEDREYFDQKRNNFLSHTRVFKIVINSMIDWIDQRKKLPRQQKCKRIRHPQTGQVLDTTKNKLTELTTYSQVITKDFQYNVDREKVFNRELSITSCQIPLSKLSKYIHFYITMMDQYTVPVPRSNHLLAALPLFDQFVDKHCKKNYSNYDLNQLHKMIEASSRISDTLNLVLSKKPPESQQVAETTQEDVATKSDESVICTPNIIYLNLTVQIVFNNALVSWTEATTFEAYQSHYRLDTAALEECFDLYHLMTHPPQNPIENLNDSPLTKFYKLLNDQLQLAGQKTLEELQTKFPDALLEQIVAPLMDNEEPMSLQSFLKLRSEAQKADSPFRLKILKTYVQDVNKALENTIYLCSPNALASAQGEAKKICNDLASFHIWKFLIRDLLIERWLSLVMTKKQKEKKRERFQLSDQVHTAYRENRIAEVISDYVQNAQKEPNKEVSEEVSSSSSSEERKRLPKNTTGKELILHLQHMGFERVSQRGSHVKMVRDALTLIVPNHSSDTLKKGTLKSIERVINSSSL